jgi:nanoRNase/pAp phosphatase (c-di-AMP/oligoRNAs hydrolase)
MVEALSATAREVELDGHKVLAVNSASMISKLGNKLAQDRPFSIVWRQDRDGQFNYSLRSTESGLDVASIAKKYGGGGHVHAAGFKHSNILF